MRRFFITCFTALCASLSAFAVSPALNVSYFAMEADNLQRAKEICEANHLNGVEVMSTNIIYYIDSLEDMVGLVTSRDGNDLLQVETYINKKPKEIKKQLLEMGFKPTDDAQESILVTHKGDKLALKGIYQKKNVLCTLYDVKDGVAAIFTRR